MPRDYRGRPRLLQRILGCGKLVPVIPKPANMNAFSPAAALSEEEPLFGFMEGRSPAPEAPAAPSAGAKAVLEQVPADVHASLTVEQIMADALAKLQARESQLETARAAAEEARKKALAEAAQADAQADAAQAELDALDGVKAGWEAKLAALKGLAAAPLVPDESVGYVPAKHAAPKKPSKKAA